MKNKNYVKLVTGNKSTPSIQEKKSLKEENDFKSNPRIFNNQDNNVHYYSKYSNQTKEDINTKLCQERNALKSMQNSIGINSTSQ